MFTLILSTYQISYAKNKSNKIINFSKNIPLKSGKNYQVEFSFNFENKVVTNFSCSKCTKAGEKKLLKNFIKTVRNNNVTAESLQNLLLYEFFEMPSILLEGIPPTKKFKYLKYAGN